MREISISVVIPTLGREEFLKTSLDDLSKMETHSFEVLVIDQGERPSQLNFRRGYPFDLRCFHCSRPNASLARNIGLKEAKAPVILFLDDDIRITNPRFLANHLRHYDSPDVSGVYGQVLERGQPTTDQPPPEAIETDWGWINLPPNYARQCRTRNGASNNLSIRRDWAISVGGMDAWFEKGARREETEFNLRYTKRFGYLEFDPEAGLIHLSATGGSRTWGRVRRTVPMHHIAGHWYFFLRALTDRTLGVRGMAMEGRHILVALIKNPQVGFNPLIFLQNCCRATWGLAIAAGRVAKGPRRISLLGRGCYREIAISD